MWKRICQPALGLANIISDVIAQEEWLHGDVKKDLRGGKEFLLACDYGGSHQGSPYEAFAFLAASIDEMGEWDDLRKQVRHQYLRDARRISFKMLRDKRRARSLVPFLLAADRCPGILVTVVVDKQIPSLFGEFNEPDCFPGLLLTPTEGWKKRPFDRLCLVASLGATCLAGLCGTHQDILWVTDRDEIAPNPDKHDHAGWIIWYHVCTYVEQLEGRLVFLTTQGDCADRRLEDAVAIPDLAAGALAQALSHARAAGRVPGSKIACVLPSGLSDKVATILAWLGGQSAPLRRFCILLEHADGGHVAVSCVRPSLLSGSVCPYDPAASVGRLLVLA